MDADTDGYRHTDTIQMDTDKLFNFIWNSRFHRWIDWIHDCIHDSTHDTDRDADGYRYNLDRYRGINCLISLGTPDLTGG